MEDTQIEGQRHLEADGKIKNGSRGRSKTVDKLPPKKSMLDEGFGKMVDRKIKQADIKGSRTVHQPIGPPSEVRKPKSASKKTQITAKYPISSNKLGHSGSSTTALSEEDGGPLHGKADKSKTRLSRSNTGSNKTSVIHQKKGPTSRLEEIKEHQTPTSKTVISSKTSQVRNRLVSQPETPVNVHDRARQAQGTPKLANSSNSGTANFRVTNKPVMQTARNAHVPNSALSLSEHRAKQSQVHEFQLPSPQPSNNKVAREVEELYARGEFYKLAAHFGLPEAKARSMKKQKSQSPIGGSGLTDPQRGSSKERPQAQPLDALEDDFTVDVDGQVT